MIRVGALALAMLALALAACGDDDDNGGGSQSGAADGVETTAGDSETTSGTDAEEGAPDGGGDDGDGDGSDSKPPSRAEYIERADRICRKAQLDIARRSAEYRDLGRALSRGSIEQQEYFQRAGALTERSGEIALRAVVDLKELSPPTSRREAIDAYLRGATTQSEILTAQGRALREGRAEEVTELNGRIAEAGQETRSAARRVGFRICGGGGD